MPCLEITKGLKNPLPPMVLKTLMPFPVASVSIYGGETQIHTLGLPSAACRQENPAAGAWTSMGDIPSACLAAGIGARCPEERRPGTGPGGSLPRRFPPRRVLVELGRSRRALARP